MIELILFGIMMFMMLWITGRKMPVEVVDEDEGEKLLRRVDRALPERKVAARAVEPKKPAGIAARPYSMEHKESRISALVGSTSKRRIMLLREILLPPKGME